MATPWAKKEIEKKRGYQGVPKERAHPVGLRQKQSIQPVLANFEQISSFSTP